MAGIIQVTRDLEDVGMSPIVEGVRRRNVERECRDESTAEESVGTTETGEGSAEDANVDSSSEWEEAMKGDDVKLSPEAAAALKSSTIGLYCMYALVGINYGFFAHYINIPLCQYIFGPMGEPGRSTVQQCNVSSSIITMPWNFKVFYGFLIDSFPLCGSPRRWYIIMGWTVSMALLLGMTFAADNLASGDHGFDTYCIMCMVQCVFYMFGDVAGDGMTVELTKLEPEETRGSILTTGQMVRFALSLVVNIIALLFMNGPSWIPAAHHASTNGTDTAEVCGKSDPGLVFSWEISFKWIHGVLFLFELPFFIGMCYFLRDPPRSEETHMRKRDAIRKVWTLMKTKAMLFLIIYSYGSIALAALTNPASNNIANIAQPTTLQFSLGSIFGSLLFLLGVACFKRYFMNTNWRLTFIWTSLLVVGQCGIQLLVIYNAWGVGQDGWFFVFGSNILLFIQGIGQVLSSLATAEIAPPGLEATIYESLTSISNGAITLNTNIQNLFVPVFNLNGVSASTYFPCPSNPNPDQAKMNQDMANATYFTIVVNIAATLIFCVFFPKSKAQTREWRDDNWWHTRTVGFTGAILGAGGFAFAIIVSFLSLFPSTMCLKIAGGEGCSN